MKAPVSILIVEDEAVYLLDLIHSFEERGYKVLWSASSGERAVETARAEKPSFILMDIRLCGEMNGIEAARQIRKFSDTPIIFMTGYISEFVEADTDTIPNSAFLHKPLDMSTIERQIQRFLSGSGT